MSDDQPARDAPAPALAEGWQRLAAEDLSALAWLHEAERDTDVLSALHANGFPTSLSLAADHATQTAMLHALTAIAAQRPVADVPPSTSDDLAADFNNIYLTHGMRAAPYGSVWLDEDHLMMQAPTFAVREVYKRHGVHVADWRHMADDHISHELRFVALLLERGEDKEAARFLKQHILSWLPQFAQRVGQRAGTPFYAALATLTLAACEDLSTRLPSVAVLPPVITERGRADAQPGCGV